MDGYVWKTIEDVVGRGSNAICVQCGAYVR